MSVKKNILFDIYKKLKLKRIVLNQEEYAAKLGYSRAHMHRLMNNPNDVDEALINEAKALLEENIKETKNVSRETIEDKTIAQFLKVIQQHTEIILNQSQTIKNLTEPPNLSNAKNV